MALVASAISSADASAIIDSALADAQTPNAQPNVADTPTLLPAGSNPIAPPPPSEETAEEKKLRQAKEDMLGKEQAEALAKEEAEQAAREATLLGMAEKALTAGKSKANDANVKIGNVPTPGSIAVPLILLLIFFFILISYNGNTRMKWLWLVLTNNAYISASQGAATSGSTSSGPNYIPMSMPFEIPLPKLSINGMGGNPYS